MIVALVQSDPLWARPAENLARLDSLLEKSQGAGLIVLPEMFAHGFVTEPEGVAEEGKGPVLAWMKERSVRMGAAIAGSIPTLEGGRYYNRMHFVTPAGEDYTYDKRHLFTYGGENLAYTAGAERTEVEFGGMRILLQVCYDLRFPVFSRNRADRPYDLALYIASWPRRRSDAWKALVRARAIENQCFVAGVNRVGADPSNDYSGDSVLLDPLGRTIAACTPGREEVVTGEADPALLATLRKAFPVLEDGEGDK